MIFWEVLDIIVALIPEKIRKIIGSILLIFGTVLFLWGWLGDWDSGLEGIGGFVAVLGGGSLIGLGLYFLTFWWYPFFWDFEQEDDISPESIMINRKQQIHCPSCKQKLNIPLSYSGKISCPACRIYIALDEGIIQAEGLPSVHS